MVLTVAKEALMLSVTRETLLDPLSKVIGVVEQKHTIPILSNILIEVTQGELSIAATDMEQTLVAKSSLIEPVSDLKITLPAKKLVDIIKSLPENSLIEFFRQDGQILVKSGRSRYLLSTLPPEDFPIKDSIKPLVAFTIEQDTFAQMLQRTAFAMSQNNVRYTLQGALLEITADSITAVATDGHRMAVNSISAKNSPTVIQTIIPRKAVMLLTKILSGSNDTINIQISDNTLVAATNEFTLSTKQIDGKYPDYKKVIPHNQNKIATIKKATFKNALQRTAIFCPEKINGIKLEFKPNTLHISANDSQRQTAEEEIVIHYDGPQVQVGVNVSYLLDNLSIFKSDTINILLSDDTSPITIEEVDSPYDSTFVIMPIRL